MQDNFNKACKEIVEILKYVSDEDKAKIPREIREMFEEEMDKDYEFSVDTQIPIEEQSLLKETKAILSNIFRDYWATPYQRERIIAKQNYDRKKLEEQKKERYNPDNIFGIKNISSEVLKKENEDKEIIRYKQNFIIKIWNKLKKLIRKDS